MSKNWRQYIRYENHVRLLTRAELAALDLPENVLERALFLADDGCEERGETAYFAIGRMDDGRYEIRVYGESNYRAQWRPRDEPENPIYPPVYG